MDKPPTLPYRGPLAARRGRGWLVALASVAALLALGLPRGQRVLEEYRQRQSVRRAVLSRFHTAIANTHRHVLAGNPENFGAARVGLDQARLARASNPALFSPTDLAALDARVIEQETALAEAEGRLLAALGPRPAPVRAGERDGCNLMGGLYRTAARLVRERRFTEALGVVDQIIVLDPPAVRARLLRPVIALAALIQQLRTAS